MKKTAFGSLPSGERVDLFTLGNRQGFEVSITNYGGIVTAIRVPDAKQGSVDVALGFNDLASYLQGHPYFGAITGRVAGRITRGRFDLAGKSYTLAINNGPNHLHGGVVGLDKRLWQAETDAAPGKLRLSYLSPHGEEGYPGNVTMAVEYSVTEDNGLRIDYEATTDRPTLLSLTNHSYFNLAGEGSGNVRGHEVQIFADRYVPTDKDLTLEPHARPVEGQPNDFRQRVALDQRIDGLWLSHGDNYVLSRQQPGLMRAARVREPVSGRTMEVLTTESCVQFYTGKFLDGSLLGKSGQRYGTFGGLCVECQKFPMAIGPTEFESAELHPGQTYRQTTIYRFGQE